MRIFAYASLALVLFAGSTATASNTKGDGSLVRAIQKTRGQVWECQDRIWEPRQRSNGSFLRSPSIAYKKWVWRLWKTRRATCEYKWSVIVPWLPTYRCERGSDGWRTDTGNGYYGGIQFDYTTWRDHGGFRYARYAHKATPYQQVLVAERLTYDGWPNCPNP